MPKPNPLLIVQVTAEMKPYSKTGGLADVTGALPKALAALGHTVITITPLHRTIEPKDYRLKRLLFRQKMTIDNERYYYNVWEHQPAEGSRVLFIDQAEFFKRRHRLYGYKDGNLRYYFFCRAALETLQALAIKPDVIHCHDWHSGLIPNLMLRSPLYRAYFYETATIMTIHNIAFQMAESGRRLRKKDEGRGLPVETQAEIARLNFMRRGTIYADAISTVSGQYAREIRTPEFGSGLEDVLERRRKRLFGILNGIDYAHFDPRHDNNVAVKYHLSDLYKKRRNKSILQKMLGLDVDDNVPIIGMASRITEQKGFELLFEVLPDLLKSHVQIAIVGSGDPAYEKIIRKFKKDFPDKVGIQLEFSEKLASIIYAGSDMFLMPSRFEPCGLGQMIALRYGTIPIVHSVGGLADTIVDYDPQRKRGNGFVFQDFTPLALLAAIVRGLESYKYRDRWEKLMRSGMQQSYSWELPAKQYIRLFRFARAKHRRRSALAFKAHPQLIKKINQL